MLNTLWPIFIILSFSYGILSGRADAVNQSIFDSASSAVELSVSLLGTMCLWNGIIQIATKTSLMNKITKFLKPLMRFLFPGISEHEEAHKEISMNIVANLMGIGNAATPLGLKAMSSLQKVNKRKDTLSDPMMMLIVLNTASIQILPTTIIAIRTSLGSSEPTSIIIPVWIATIFAAISAIIATKILIKKKRWEHG